MQVSALSRSIPYTHKLELSSHRYLHHLKSDNLSRLFCLFMNICFLSRCRADGNKDHYDITFCCEKLLLLFSASQNVFIKKFDEKSYKFRNL